jgi:hypothetical protein
MGESPQEDIMRLLLKIVAVLIFGPLAIGLLLIAAIAAIVAVPIVWEEIVVRFTAPPDTKTGQV